MNIEQDAMDIEQDTPSDRFLISVTYDQSMEGEEDIEDSGFEIERTYVDEDELIQYAQNFGIQEASSSSPSSSSWFLSTEPRRDRDYFEKGIQKYYGLHIHEINGEKPSDEDIQRTGDLIGVKFSQRIEAQPFDSMEP